ncbi:NADH-quinone oxidoreductase subunit NuoF [Porticoccus sp. W117]|uniref:formate dehydrogenase beta subunit n=1 Tax=Porticoccus sp. W117 TaxID=3054777 RepID=UPI002592E8A5|nr:NADH-quinone oxidoreductase subunit NuoF [Porticoccus sp. W117]MDM3871869.1 NADH-quinone oxidoreductase subunit NuoF [Porticoccus sp. W117]
MTVTVFVPSDTTARSLGADQVAAEIQLQAARHGAEVALVRNSTRGLYWLETLVEVETGAGRIAYGPVEASDVESLFAADFLNGGDHPLRQGPVAEIPQLANQQRRMFARLGIGDPLSLQDYRDQDGFIGLQKALAMEPQAIVDEVKTSGLRGRGGAGFPTGIKWQTVLDCDDDEKYIVCNADEGDSGTFADRLVMEGDPFALIEGMTIAGLAVGAEQGYIYLRCEYPLAERILNQVIETAYQNELLGDDILGSGKRFHLEVRLAAGAYICGEETSLLESLEGKRGLVRAKPPLPAIEGLFGQPTVVNNVLSLTAVVDILANGGAAYAELGIERSRGTMPFQLAGNIKQGGLVEVPFGITLRELLYDFGGGSASGRPIKAVQVGGPLGAYLSEAQFDTPMDYEAFAAIGAVLGHGGIVVFDDTVDMSQQARFAMEFCAEESCGKCTPCRIGSTRGVEVLDKVIEGDEREKNLALLNDLCDTMEVASLCALGGMTPFPVRSAVQQFREDFE